jgi:hypothetical protein
MMRAAEATINTRPPNLSARCRYARESVVGGRDSVKRQTLFGAASPNLFLSQKLADPSTPKTAARCDIAERAINYMTGMAKKGAASACRACQQ